jgi:hypothetical protein
MQTHNRLLLATALTFGASAGYAIEPMPPVDPAPVADDLKPTFESLDTNKDGQVAKTEVPVDHELNTLFASFDEDADTYLSRVEFDEYAEEDQADSDDEED